MNIYELYGRQAERLSTAEEFHRVTMVLLAELRDGKVQPSQLVISTEGWQLQDPPGAEPIPLMTKTENAG